MSRCARRRDEGSPWLTPLLLLAALCSVATRGLGTLLRDSLAHGDPAPTRGRARATRCGSRARCGPAATSGASAARRARRTDVRGRAALPPAAPLRPRAGEAAADGLGRLLPALRAAARGAGRGTVALHVADGSQVIVEPRRRASLTVFVGAAGTERYGSCLAPAHARRASPTATCRSSRRATSTPPAPATARSRSPAQAAARRARAASSGSTSTRARARRAVVRLRPRPARRSPTGIPRGDAAHALRRLAERSAPSSRTFRVEQAATTSAARSAVAAYWEHAARRGHARSTVPERARQRRGAQPARSRT